MAILWIALPILLLGILSYHRASLIVWTITYGLYLVFLVAFSTLSPITLSMIGAFFLVLAFILNVKPVRRMLITQSLFKTFQKSLPALSLTEKEALAAGTVGWDGELFSGMPDWSKCLAYPSPQLTPEELDFLNGPVSELCAMIDNWDITHNRFNLPDEMWQFLKTNRFFGMIIPKQYGGKEFSAYAHSTILTKIAGLSSSVASVVAVPNSLGPAELLLHYGTDEQRNYYLPRLAQGIEIPCFALTGPEAGSDASAMPDYGVVCKGTFENKEIIGIRINWNKRYITLAPIATVLGLAFKLYDPDHLIGGKESLGITCALIPTNLPGITIGRRHYPLNCAFPNGPTQGRDVFIPLDWIIGGVNMAGQGWRMIVECLATGRAISLPSMATGGAKIGSYTTGAYSRIRNQFHLPIGKFGGVEEALARIAGNTYIMEATRLFTVAAIDRGEKPAVPAAISKYHVTELGRKVINDAMDIHGGKGICMGPKNYLANNYQETPISITVEGANILTRSMIIFGQGAIRCHPYILKEMEAVQLEDKKRGLKVFDNAIFAHVGFMLSNIMRTFVLGITHARWAGAPHKEFKRYYQYLTRFSAALALVSDVSMILLGGSLKRKEKLSARLGDVLSMLYLGSAVLKQYEDHQSSEEERDVVMWACEEIIFTAQQQLHAALVNFPNPIVGALLKAWVFPWGMSHKEPTDKLGHRVARLMLNPNALRHILAKDAYLEQRPNNPVGYIEMVLKKVILAEPLEQRLYEAVRDKKIKGHTFEQKVKEGIAKEILTEAEAAQLLDGYQSKREILAVDDFAPEELEGLHAHSAEIHPSSTIHEDSSWKEGVKPN
ncbi:MAG: acyl-CoA dehydrogenase [Gammaproteobacteria bacterium]|nr:acyl-CoA dehydrogenase [Gammaproteobacteria bacterium]